MTSVRIRLTRMRALTAIAMLLALAVPAFAQSGSSKAVVSQIAAIQQIKQNFTPAQKKMDSSLAFAAVGQKNPAAVSSFASAMPQLATTTTGKVLVDINGTVSPALVQAIQKAGGDVLYQSTAGIRFTRRCRCPASSPSQRVRMSSALPRRRLARTSVGSLTSQGYVAHRAKQVVTGGITGAGVNVGVLSDSAPPAKSPR